MPQQWPEPMTRQRPGRMTVPGLGGYAVRAVLTTLVVPPISLLLLALVCLAIAARPGIRLTWRRRLGDLAGLSLVMLTILSLPVVGNTLLQSLSVPAGDARDAGAIVILGGDVQRLPDDGVTVGPLTLERLRAGAALHRQTGLPILVTGGVVDATSRTVGALMAESLQSDFGVPVRWVEAVSFDTWENASMSQPLLAAAGVKRVLLVTHAWHMRRGLLAFARAGLDAVPAPVRAEMGSRYTPGEFMPRVSAWTNSYFALHEWIGLAWYAVRR